MHKILSEAQKIINREQFKIIEKNNKADEISIPEMLQLVRFLRYDFKRSMMQLLATHAQLDAWFGMAMAVKKYGLVFPCFVESPQPFIEMKGLYHILLEIPVSYDVSLNRQTNFLFLTGANMAGKALLLNLLAPLFSWRILVWVFRLKAWSLVYLMAY